jgi:hypothetical protein
MRSPAAWDRPPGKYGSNNTKKNHKIQKNRFILNSINLEYKKISFKIYILIKFRRIGTFGMNSSPPEIDGLCAELKSVLHDCGYSYQPPQQQQQEEAQQQKKAVR